MHNGRIKKKKKKKKDRHEVSSVMGKNGRRLVSRVKVKESMKSRVEEAEKYV